MKLERLAAFYARLATPLTHFLLLAAVFSLPVTSLPLLSRLMGGTVVAPPTLVFVGLGMAVSLPLALVKRHAWPGEIVPLVVFILLACISSLASFFGDLPIYKAVSPDREVLQAILTLLLGAACFVFFATAIRRPEQYRSIFGVLDLGGMLIILWCLTQLFYTYVHGREFAPAWLLSLHNTLSTTGMMEFVYQRRVTGFALEPSWLAHQMNCLYLPYWLGASLTGFSAFRGRVWKISAENVLLACGIGISFASLSRIGYLSLMLVLAYLFWQGNRALAERIARRASGSEKGQRGLRLGVQLGILAGFIVLALAGAYLLTRLDYRFALLFQQNFLTTDFFFLANNLSLAERFAYWGLGWNVFTRAPWVGVGLGNVGFYFESLLPSFGWALNEFLKIQLEFSVLLNAKNLWIRLLAETGIVGAAVFVTWLYTVYASARSLRLRKEPVYRTLYWMGTLAVIALIGEGFSIDSFALPYYWTAFGLAIAASFMARNTQAAGETPAPGKD